MKIGLYQYYWGRIGGGQRYLGAIAEILARQHDVELVHHCADFDRARFDEALELDLSAVSFRYLPEPQRPVWSSPNPFRRLDEERQWASELSRPYDLFINNSDTPPCFSHARRGVLITHFPLLTADEFHGRNSAEWQGRPAWKRLVARVFHHLEWQQRFGTYQLYFVNSHYGQKWIRRRWGLRAGVIYPPLRRGYPAADKEPLILSIGAFHHLQHKRQDILIDVFKELCDKSLSGWRYVLVGASGPSPEDQAYVARLRAAAQGYPVEIRTDVSGDELRDLLGRASLVWHSMGYGVDEERDPGKFEHFGMVATEAMTNGCVPIVFNGGGLREIVTDGQNGMLWSTLEELKARTLRVAQDESLRKSLSEAALRRSADFSGKVFESRVLEALAPVLNGK
jgi:glycosyltransferase involved in cell wall biosynthesis